MNFVKKYFGLIFVVILSLFAVLPFFQTGFFPMHDDTQVARVYEMGKALKDGMFPVRWVQDLGYGYGYPIFNFYAPLSYYVGGFFNLLGFDALASTKIMMIIGILLAGIFMYLLSREFWGEVGGIISALFYMYAPYHALDIYVRGDVGEFWAYAFIPLIFLSFYKLHKILDSTTDLAQNSSKFKIQNSKLQFKIKNLWKWIIVGAVGYAGVILSHNLTAMMVTPFLLIVILLYCYIAYKDKKYLSMFYILCSIFLGLVLSAFYWLPALLEMKYTNVMSQIGGGADFRDHFVCLSQLWESLWEFGGSTKGCIDGMSFRLGKIHILFSVISLILISVMALKNKLFIHSDKIIPILLTLFGLIFSVFLMLEISKPVWETISLMAFFQYPWRFLLLSSFFTSFLAGSVILFLRETVRLTVYSHFRPCIKYWAGSDRESINKFWIPAFAGMTILVLLFFNAKLFSPQTIISKTAADYTSEYALKWETSKISDEYLPKDFVKPKSFSEIQKSETYSKNYPQQSFIQKIANFLSLAGAVSLILGIIYTRSEKD